MASKGLELCALLFLMIMLCHRATAQSGCTTALVGLTPCLNYVTGNSSTPSASCCSQLATVVQSQPLCLCALLTGGGSSLGFTINQTQALSLPGACNVQTPPVSQCNGMSTWLNYMLQLYSKNFNMAVLISLGHFFKQLPVMVHQPHQ